MYEYNLNGKNVLLSLDKSLMKYVKNYGIKGSPLFAHVYKMESDGLWLETQDFKLKPKASPRKAHIFIPAKAIISAVVFPSDSPSLENEADIHQIGFRPKKKKKKKKKKKRKNSK